MSRPCAACSSASRAAIDRAIAAGQTHRAIEAAFGISKSAISRHAAHATRNIDPDPRRPTVAAPVVPAIEAEGAGPEPTATYRARTRPSPTSAIPEGVQHRNVRGARDAGFSDDEIAARLDVPAATVSRWLAEDDAKLRRRVDKATAVDLIIPVHRDIQAMRAVLHETLERARIKADHRGTLDVVRELRRWVMLDMALAGQRGAFNNPLIATDVSDRDDLDISKAAERMLRAFAPERDEPSDDDDDELTMDQLADRL
jgi:hypothetical protein